MFDTIYIGTSGLVGYSKGLRVVSNNLSNVNTPGFKGSQLQFADFFYGGEANQSQEGSGGSNSAQLGAGLNTLSTELNFKSGAVQKTGNDLDLAINGTGFFVLKDGDKTYYTRSGSFSFNDKGILVSNANKFHVQGIDANGKLGDITLEGLDTNPFKATTSIKFAGNLPSDTATGTPISLTALEVIDVGGFSHQVTLDLTKNAAPAVDTWTVTMKEAGTLIGTGTIQFSGGNIVPASSKVNIVFSPADNSTPFLVELDFSANVVSRLTANGGTKIAFSSQDGYKAGGVLSKVFDESGKLKFAYDNGQKAEGAAVALARFDDEQEVDQFGGALFDVKAGNKVHIGVAKTESFGSFTIASVEGSNVDLAQEFSNLIVMQRGYQASSRVVSTANEMIQELFDMKGRN